MSPNVPAVWLENFGIVPANRLVFLLGDFSLFQQETEGFGQIVKPDIVLEIHGASPPISMLLSCSGPWMGSVQMPSFTIQMPMPLSANLCARVSRCMTSWLSLEKVGTGYKTKVKIFKIQAKNPSSCFHKKKRKSAKVKKDTETCAVSASFLMGVLEDLFLTSLR